jgi:hypothetical protein
MEPALREEFYTAIQPDQAEWGRTISGDTVSWWMKQSELARSVINDKDAIKLPEALEKFSQWCGDSNTEMWGNGADFDCVILSNAYYGCGLKKPWSYSNNRCYRTLKNLGIKLDSGEGISRTEMGEHHNALADAKYQAHYAVAYLRQLDKMKVRK